MTRSYIIKVNLRVDMQMYTENMACHIHPVHIVIVTALHSSRNLFTLMQCHSVYCITSIFRVEDIFAIFANWHFARNFPPAKIISTANGISRNSPPAKFTSREIFLPAKIKLNRGLSLYNMQQKRRICPYYKY